MSRRFVQIVNALFMNISDEYTLIILVRRIRQQIVKKKDDELKMRYNAEIDDLIGG